MLDEATQLDISEATQDRWTERCEAGEMAGYMQRKERGHGLADFVEDVTVTMLARRCTPSRSREPRCSISSLFARTETGVWRQSGRVTSKG
jgi:hypothetical protein